MVDRAKRDAIWDAYNQAADEVGEEFRDYGVGSLEGASQEVLQAASLMYLAEIAGSLRRIEKMMEKLGPLAEMAEMAAKLKG